MTEKTQITLDSVGGYEAEKTKVRKIIHFIRNYDTYRKEGVYLSRGMVITGRNGGGKSLFCSAIVNEANVPTFYIDGDKVDSKTVSTVIRETFAKAREQVPSIIVIDEIASLLPSYDNRSPEAFAIEKTLLTEIDGVDKNSDGVFVIGMSPSFRSTTSKALFRQGRLEIHIDIQDPTLEEREKIAAIYLNVSPRLSAIKPGDLARITEDFNGAQIKSLINNTLLSAIDQGIDKVTMASFYPEIEEIGRGCMVKQSQKVDKAIAIHETGHFLASYLTSGEFGILSVSGSESIGGTFTKVSGEASCERESKTKEAYDKTLMVALGGLAACEVMYGVKYSGAGNDIERARKTISQMCNEGLLGFDNLLTMPFGFYTEDFGSAANAPEDYVAIERRYLSDIYGKTMALLSPHKDFMDKVASLLCEKYILTDTELKELVEQYLR